MGRITLLRIDAIINFVLGLLLLLALPLHNFIPEFLGVPAISNPFYPSIMGGILIGIGFSLWIESSSKDIKALGGLGIGGAIIINLCGGLVLLGWLIWGKLDLPLRGSVFLWVVVLILLWISAIEIKAYWKHSSGKS